MNIHDAIALSAVNYRNDLDHDPRAVMENLASASNLSMSYYPATGASLDLDCQSYTVQPSGSYPPDQGNRTFAETQLEVDEIFYATFPNARPRPRPRQPFVGSEAFYPDDNTYSIQPDSGYYNPGSIIPGPAFTFPAQSEVSEPSAIILPSGGSDNGEEQSGSRLEMQSSASDDVLAIRPITQQHLVNLHQDQQSVVTADGIPDSQSHSNPYPKLTSSDSNEPMPRSRVRIPSSGSVYPTLTDVTATKDQSDEPAALTSYGRRESYQEDLSPQIQPSGPMTKPVVRRSAIKRVMSSPPSSPSDAGPSPSSPTSERSPQARKPALACIFCRHRKIACGQPNAESEDRTCNQCRRRSLKCEYPLESRRGMRKKKVPPVDTAD